jgi:hypothetical protein
LTEQFCVLSTGEFYGIGTDCDLFGALCANGPPTTGACCVAGECTIITPELCSRSFGEFQGLGSECASVTCPSVGACCIDGVCVQLSDAICELRGGQFSEEGIECGEVECMLPDAIGTGCSAPFWRTPGLPQWPAPYRRSDIIAGVFTIPSCITDNEMHGRELHKGMSMFGGEGDMNKAARRLMREAVPALLNAQLTFIQKCGSDYPIGDPMLVVQLVNQTLATCDPSSVSLLTDALGTYNSLGCATSRAGRCLDEDDRTRARGQPGGRD